MKGWSLSSYLLASMALHMNSLTPNKKNLIITWGQTMSQRVLKFPMTPRFFDPDSWSKVGLISLQEVMSLIPWFLK